MDLTCTDPGKLDAMILGAATLLLILNGLFGISVVALRGWFALLPLSLPHIYALLCAFFLLLGMGQVFPDALADRRVALPALWGLYLVLFALAVGWTIRRFGFSWGCVAMQVTLLGLTLLVLIVAAYTPDSSEVTWPYCDGTSRG